MLISSIYKTNFINYKKKRTILENIHKKLIFIILFLFLTSFYFLTKTNNYFTETKFNFLNRILINNGLIFQSQVSYLIPIFGTILSYIFLKELITIKVLISLIAVIVGIYFVRRADNKKTT